MRSHVGLCLTALCAVTLGCGSRVTGPATGSALRHEDLRLELATSTRSGALGEPLIIRAIIRNAGTSNAVLINPCPNPYMRVFDAHGSELRLHDPRDLAVCVPECCNPFPPGSQWEISLTFDGWIYSETGARLAAPSGTYRVSAQFTYSRAASSGEGWEQSTLTREADFDWP